MRNDSGWPLGRSYGSMDFFFLTFGLVGAIALRAIRAAAGDRGPTQDSADRSLVIGNRDRRSPGGGAAAQLGFRSQGADDSASQR